MNNKLYITMNRIILSLMLCVLISMISTNTLAQKKQYIFAPQEYVPSKRPHIMNKDTVYVSISDNRGIPSNSKIKYSSAQLVDLVGSIIKKAYTNTHFVFNNDNYAEECIDNSLNIKIGITRYGATFGTYGWTANCEYEIYFCFRLNGVNYDATNISTSEETGGNPMGYFTAKKCLNNTFVSSTNEMLNIIDALYQSINNQMTMIRLAKANQQSVQLSSNTTKEELVSSDILTKLSTSNSIEVLEPKAIYNKYNKAVFMIYTENAINATQGSGFFVSKDGIAISNYHVFKGTYKGLETIKLYDGQEYKVKEVYGYSEKFDYIVFKVEGNEFDYIPISLKDIAIGDEVYAIGSPKGLNNTFSNGLISQKHKDFIWQISVPIDHGSSGGVLLNKYGEAIGITTGGIDSSNANLNFAVDLRAIFSTQF